LSRFLDTRHDQPAELLGSGWATLDPIWTAPLGGPWTPPAATPPAAAGPPSGSLGSPGRSALTAYRRRSEELAGWTRTLVWPAPLVAAAGLTGDGYVVFHDLAVPGNAIANVDHLVIGLTGLFVIDSKQWTGSVHQSVVNAAGRTIKVQRAHASGIVGRPWSPTAMAVDKPAGGRHGGSQHGKTTTDGNHANVRQGAQEARCSVQGQGHPTGVRPAEGQEWPGIGIQGDHGQAEPVR
jgi:hypothetical protein